MTKKANRLSKIYVLGNPLVEEESLPVKLIPKLINIFPDIQFIHLDTTEELPEENHLVIIDMIINLREIRILTDKDLDKIESSPNYSLHDFDLAMNLKLMKKRGKLSRVTIIGIPPNMNENEAIKGIKNSIQFQKMSSA